MRKICEWCQGPVVIPPRSRKDQIYCCNSCRWSANSSKFRARRRLPLECVMCEREFYPPFGVGKQKKYCCQPCRSRAKYLRDTGQPKPTCKICGKYCPIGRSSFCSVECGKEGKRRLASRSRPQRAAANRRWRARLKAQKLERRARLAALFKSAPAPTLNPQPMKGF